MGRKLRRYGFGALGATALAATAIVAPLIGTGPAWAPVTRNLSAAPASFLPRTVSATEPVSVVRTVLDEAGRPVTTKHTATSRTEAERLVREAQKAPGALAVEVDSPVFALGVPAANDPYRAQEWALPKIGATDAWNTSTGAGVTVAVLDTGVDATHPDLAGQVLSGKNMITGQTGTSYDTFGHGTHVAGTIAAATGNGVGVAGVAPDARILPVKVLSDNGGGVMSDVATGITWAADNGADVVNMSLGSTGQTGAVTNAIAYARSKGVVVIASAGNSRANGSPTSYPAADPGVIGVAATDSADNVGSFSNAGGYVDIAAPGVSIVSTVPNNNYSFYNGTSMAAPHVAALAALLLGKNPSLTPDQVEQKLTSTAVDLGASGRDNDFGYGRIDAVAALAATPAAGAPTTPPTSSPTPTTPAPATPAPTTPAPTTPSLPTPAISSDGESVTVLYGTALKTTFTVTRNGAAWPKLAAQLCTADNGAETFKCKKVTTSATGTVTHTRKATAAQRFKLVIAAGKANLAAESDTYQVQLRSEVTLAAKKNTLTVTLTGAAKQVAELQRSADGVTWTTDRTFKASAKSTLSKITAGHRYRVVVPDLTTIAGATSNTVQM